MGGAAPRSLTTTGYRKESRHNGDYLTCGLGREAPRVTRTCGSGHEGGVEEEQGKGWEGEGRGKRDNSKRRGMKKVRDRDTADVGDTEGGTVGREEVKKEL